MRGQESTSLRRAAPAASRSESRSCATRSLLESSPSKPARSLSRSSGSSITFCGKTFSASPGTNATSNESPRADAIFAT